MSWFRPQCTEVLPDGSSWRHAGLRVLTLDPGGESTLHTGDIEMLVLPLAGGGTVRCGDRRIELAGRPDVFTAISDFCYLPPDSTATLSSVDGGRFALPFAAAGPGLPLRHGPAAEVPVELRGTGTCSRQVNNLATADSFDCQSLIVVEVLTPGGNWSSFPPHKHDQQGPAESELEEIYYFEVARGGVAYQRVYASSPERPIDVLAEVRSGDVVLVPHGWHGPSIAMPGRDLYYLNVMAGPGPRRWQIRDDPGYAWVRPGWAGQPVDPRLPLTGTEPR